MKVLCYLPFSYDYICKNGIQYLECEVINGIAFFPKHEIFPGAGYGFYCKSVGEIKDNKEIYKYQKDLEDYESKSKLASK